MIELAPSVRAGPPMAGPFVAMDDGDRMDLYHASSLIRSKAINLTDTEATIIETFILDGFGPAAGF